MKKQNTKFALHLFVAFLAAETSITVISFSVTSSDMDWSTAMK